MKSYTVTRRLHIHSGRKQLREMRPGPMRTRPPGRTPRISKLMALAIHFDDMVTCGQIEDYATIARFGRVSRARVTQIINMAQLAPDIQEEILFLPKTHRNRDVLNTTTLQPLAREPDWQRQREMWAELKQNLPPHVVRGDNETEGASPTQG